MSAISMRKAFSSSSMVNQTMLLGGQAPDFLNTFSAQFLEAFYQDLTLFNHQSPGDNIIETGKNVVDIISQYTPLRNFYISFLEEISAVGSQFDAGLLRTFLQKLRGLTIPEKDLSLSDKILYSHFEFFAYELFIYSVAIPLKNQNYKQLEHLFLHDYSDAKVKLKVQDFTIFNYDVSTIDAFYNKLHNKNFHSAHADLIMSRIPENVSRDLVMDADLLCRYIGELKELIWFPKTYIYRSDLSQSQGFFRKLVSKKYFENTKVLLGVKTIQDLVEKLNLIQSRTQILKGYPRSFTHVPSIVDQINLRTLGIYL